MSHRIAVGIPTLNNLQGLQTLLPQLYLQADVEVDLFLVANGPQVDQFGQRWVKQWGGQLLGHRDHLSVGASWNHICLSAFSFHGHDRVILLNDDVRLPDAETFIRMIHIDQLHRGQALITDGLDGYHCFLINKRLFLRVGKFDEGFWPAYYEDNDYQRRIELHHYHHPDEDKIYELPIQPLTDHRVHGSQIDPKVEAWLKQCQPIAHQRYLKKWGGPAKQEIFTLPWDGGVESPSTRAECPSLW